MAFNFVRLQGTFKLTANLTDPYALFAIRVLFPDALRRASGCRHSSCDSCPNRECPYFSAFSRQLTPDPAALRRYQKPASPFVFDIPILPRVMDAGNEFSLGITLMGGALHHWQSYLEAIESLFDGAGSLPFRAKLLVIETCGYRAERMPITPGREGLMILSDVGLAQSCVLPSFEIPIRVNTPLRIIQQGRPVRDLSGSLLLRSLMRRVSSLAYYYGDDEPEMDFKWLSQQAERSFWKKAKFRWVTCNGLMSGLIGEGILAGVAPEFYYYLLCGEVFHLGKGASYGQGKFQLS